MNNTPIDSDKPFAEEGYALMGAAFEVHRELGGGMLEEIYQQSLEIELRLCNIPFKTKEELSVYYKGHKLQKRYIPDLIVYGQIVVELKTTRELIPEHESQLINYMRISQQPIGYLVNFGPIKNVIWKRFILSEFLSRP